MEFPDLGKHCHYCKQFDFLPLHCSNCDHDFCTIHSSQLKHKCSSMKKKQPSKLNRSASNIDLIKCSHKGCNKRIVAKLLHDGLNKHYCDTHGPKMRKTSSLPTLPCKGIIKDLEN